MTPGPLAHRPGSAVHAEPVCISLTGFPPARRKNPETAWEAVAPTHRALPWRLERECSR